MGVGSLVKTHYAARLQTVGGTPKVNVRNTVAQMLQGTHDFSTTEFSIKSRLPVVFALSQA